MTIKGPQRTFVKPFDLQPSDGGHHHSDGQRLEYLRAHFHWTTGHRLTLNNFLSDCWEGETWEEPAEARGSDLEMKMADDSPPPTPCSTGDPAAEEWSQWSICSLTCGQGWQVRTRSCVSSPYGTLCSGALRETRMCNNTSSCPGEPGIVASGMC